MIPDTRYARTADGSYVAYQVVGDGGIPVVFSPGWFSNVDLIWEQPDIEPFLRRLAAANRLIMFDRRGTGLSDAVSDAPDLDTMMDDVRAVMDAASTERAVLVGVTLSCALMALFAATFPERTLGLVLIQAVARVAWAPDYPWGETAEYHRDETDRIAEGWGTGAFERWFLARAGHPGADDPRYVARTARYLRHSMTPGMAVIQKRVWIETDYRHVLPAIQVPTLVLDPYADPAVGGRVADLIPGAEFVHLPDDPRLPWIPGSERTAGEIERFIDSIREEEIELERVLATVLFTDVVGSTDHAAQVGDARWRELLEEHNRIVRAHLTRYRGREVKTMGDGFLATFDAPGRAIRCAKAVVRSAKGIGVDLRAGVHTGELTRQDGDIGGIAVAIAARVLSSAASGEILVSSTVKDLVAGSGLAFEDRGEHRLKGVPGPWRLFAVGGG
jgi:class 3 adenylate cyclase/pimeloyl-ACP methyl ester carboxylesterase